MLSSTTHHTPDRGATDALAYSHHATEETADDRRRLDAVNFAARAVAQAADPLTTAEFVRTLALPDHHLQVWWPALVRAHGRHQEDPPEPVTDYESYVDHVAGGKRGHLRNELLRKWETEQFLMATRPWEFSGGHQGGNDWSDAEVRRAIDALPDRFREQEARICVTVGNLFPKDLRAGTLSESLADPRFGANGLTMVGYPSAEWLRLLCHVNVGTAVRVIAPLGFVLTITTQGHGGPPKDRHTTFSWDFVSPPPEGFADCVCYIFACLAIKNKHGLRHADEWLMLQKDGLADLKDDGYAVLSNWSQTGFTSAGEQTGVLTATVSKQPGGGERFGTASEMVHQKKGETPRTDDSVYSLGPSHEPSFLLADADASANGLVANGGWSPQHHYGHQPRRSHPSWHQPARTSASQSMQRTRPHSYANPGATSSFSPPMDLRSSRMM